MKRIEIYKKMLRVLRGSSTIELVFMGNTYIYFIPSAYHRKTVGYVEFFGLCHLYRELSGNPVTDFVADAKKVLGSKARAGNYWFNTTDPEKAKQERMDFLIKLIKNLSNGKED